MIELEIDNKKVAVRDGGMIIEAADAAGIYIPRFCYHKKLSIAANCRMCLVEVEKSKKPLPACATPALNGMKVFTQSTMTVEAQRSVMEFLLINHPLDCPICDQGGECELQDLSLGYGNDVSRYYEGKRSVFDENLGPLISTDMTRCIQCTRCVRFGVEVAGLPELGTKNRGEALEISTYIGKTMRSELSGNIIDLCPVGALTSKPFRFTARSWELLQHPSVAPHDCIGSNIFVHTRGYEYNDYRSVMRVVPRENEKINETWLSDRDRFSYQAISSSDRLLSPRIKRESDWIEVDWSTALNYIVEKWQVILGQDTSQLGAIASPNSTLEEFFILQKLFRSLGVNNLDHRIRQLDFDQQENFPAYPGLGMELDALETLDLIFLIGSDIRHEQPLACHRLRKAMLAGTDVCILNPIDYSLNFEPAFKEILPSNELPYYLASIAYYFASKTKNIPSQLEDIEPSPEAIEMAKKLELKKNGIILLGIQAITHPRASLIRALVEFIAKHCGMTVGSLSEGSNAAGAWLAGMLPHRGPAGSLSNQLGLTASQMFSKQLKSYLLLNVEPELDCAYSADATSALSAADFVVVLTPFLSSAQSEYADVLLPIAPFFEESGTFVNLSGEWQKFTAATRPLGEAKPAWKIFRVLGNLFNLDGFDYMDIDQVNSELKNLIETIPKLPQSALNLGIADEKKNSGELRRIAEWPMYQVDNLVRRASALQEWSAEELLIAARMNTKLASEYGVQSGEIMSFVQGEDQLDLPVLIDDRIAGNYVLIPAGISATAGFGEHMGSIRLFREHVES